MSGESLAWWMNRYDHFIETGIDERGGGPYSRGSMLYQSALSNFYFQIGRVYIDERIILPAPPALKGGEKDESSNESAVDLQGGYIDASGRHQKSNRIG